MALSCLSSIIQYSFLLDWFHQEIHGNMCCTAAVFWNSMENVDNKVNELLGNDRSENLEGASQYFVNLLFLSRARRKGAWGEGGSQNSDCRYRAALACDEADSRTRCDSCARLIFPEHDVELIGSNESPSNSTALLDSVNSATTVKLGGNLQSLEDKVKCSQGIHVDCGYQGNRIRDETGLKSFYRDIEEGHIAPH
ncbi:hypothetical protein VNO78_31533 [Psophocarpus tetragonolobus]|uniref:Uncharacterized protein n=1 Tax=Psophocarpus tetragonolobus TaxID=3891 RepID=A0AAN9RYG3_PSOTE